jgi:CheY-like chemotaxis protein/two-component sensor histidine kinase
MERRGSGDPDGQRLRAMGQRQVRNLSRLVDDLLDVSRITEGKIALRRERADLRDILRSVVETARSQAVAQSQELRVEAPEAPVWVDGDVTRLEQIGINIVNNALKYTDPGGVISVALRTVAQDENGNADSGGVARLIVRDSGRGISHELLPQVFDLFVQGDVDPDRSGGGLGLGLTLVRRLVELHGGRVTAESGGPGQGSTFTVELPLATAPSAAAAADAVVARAYPAWSGNGALGRRVVLVDDNVDVVELLKELLESRGYAVDLAHDGEHGRELIMVLRPEVALVDLGLPKLDGFEVARQVRRAGVGPGTRLIALTGYGDPETRRRAVAAGFDEHLVKPLAFDTLDRLFVTPS